MDDAQIRTCANVVANLLAERGEAPEGYIYAGLMHVGATLDDFNLVKALLIDLELVTSEPGPVLRPTTKLLRAYERAKLLERVN